MSNEDRAESVPFTVIQEHIDDESIPSSVRENLAQHYQHLSHLADNLKELGMDQHQIDNHVVEIFKEYERELEANIKRIRDAQ